MRTYDLAHRFFHEPEKRGGYANVPTSFDYSFYNGKRYWYYKSYATIIAEIRADKKGNDVLIMSDCRYSRKTSKHLNELRYANPGLPVLYVPLVADGYYRYCDGRYNFRGVLKRIASMTEQDLRKAENRNYVTHNLALYDAYVQVFNDLEKDAKKLRKSAKVRKVVEMTEQKNARLHELRERVIPEEVRAANKAKREAAAQRRMERFVAEGNTLKKLHDVFAYHRHGLSDIEKEYKRMLEIARDDKFRCMAYVWLGTDNYAHTSMHCDAPVKDVEMLCKLWKHDKPIVGLKAGIYTVLEKTDDYVKIGCHVIPTWNIELLCNALNVA